jgi:glucose-6-phosphate 1-epimerase
LHRSTDPGDLVAVLTHPTEPGLTATVHLHGARVSSLTVRGREFLFVPRRARFEAGRHPRAGIEISWPQFGRFGQLSHHGFARRSTWDVDGAEVDYAEDTVILRLRFASTDDTRLEFPKDFALNLTVTLAPASLDVRLGVRNTGDVHLSFTGGVLSHLRVEDAAQCSVRGLSHLEYVDQKKQTQDSSFLRRRAAVLTLSEEIDRIYQHAPGTVPIEVEPGRVVTVQSARLPDFGIWNPWEEGSRTMQEFDDGDYAVLLCAQSCHAFSPITLSPDGSWEGGQTLAFD